MVIRFFPSRPGHVRGFSGFEQANAQKGVEAGTFVTIGDRTLAASTDGDRLGYILAVGESPREARQRANEAEHVISIDVTASL